MGFGAKILLDSISPMGARLTTFEVTFPRIVLAEFNTHRMFSRNSASSRAIPVEDMMKRVDDDPFFPVYWGKNQKGMSAEVELSELEQRYAKEFWQEATNHALGSTKQLSDVGIHKQIANRLLEPFMWHTVLVSSTHWDNFFNRRDSKFAQPEIAKPTRMMRALFENSKPQQLGNRQWHLPLVTGIDEATLSKDFSLEDRIKISCARCARVSYLTHEGTRDPQKDLGLYNNLLTNGHMSPLEHAAMALDKPSWEILCTKQADAWQRFGTPAGNFFGYLQHRKMIPHEDNMPGDTG